MNTKINTEINNEIIILIISFLILTGIIIFKYSPEKSEISLKYKKYESFFSINIIDHGIGISESEQGMIFKRFYRSPEVEREQGLGIGLYLVREIIEKQGGYIKVRSEVGKGSTFSMFLPN